MNTKLRRRHARLWVVLGPLLIAGIVSAIVLRPPFIKSATQSDSGPGLTTTDLQVLQGTQP